MMTAKDKEDTTETVTVPEVVTTTDKLNQDSPELKVEKHAGHPRTVTIDPVEFVWAGATRYACPLCKFDDSRRETVVGHIRHRHMKRDIAGNLVGRE